MPKTDHYGNTYNGAIISFDSWNMNFSPAVHLLEHIKTNKDNESYKFYHYKQKFWFVNEYKNMERTKDDISSIIEGTNTISLNDNTTAIDQLKLKILFLQSELERAERKSMEYEMKQVTDSLYNEELRRQNELLVASNAALITDNQLKIHQLTTDNQQKIMEYDHKLVSLALENHKLRIAHQQFTLDLRSKDIVINQLCDRLKL